METCLMPFNIRSVNRYNPSKDPNEPLPMVKTRNGKWVAYDHIVDAYNEIHRLLQIVETRDLIEDALYRKLKDDLGIDAADRRPSMVLPLDK